MLQPVSNILNSNFVKTNNKNDRQEFAKDIQNNNQIELTNYEVGQAILNRNNISFRNLSQPIEITDRYNKKIEGKDHLDLPNIHVYEYPDTNLQVLINEIQNKMENNKFQASLTLANSEIQNTSIIKKNLFMKLMKMLLDNNNIKSNLTENFANFMNVDLNLDISDTNKINLLNQLITKPKFSELDLENCKKDLINTINSEKYQKDTAEYRKLNDNSLFNTKEETIKNIQNITLDDISSYYSEILKNSNAQYIVTIDKSFIDNNKKMFYSVLNSGLANKFEKYSNNIQSSKSISNQEDIRSLDNANETYLTFHYPIKVTSNKDDLIYRYLTLLEFFWNTPYILEPKSFNAKKYTLPMELKNQNINSNEFGYLDFGFTPEGNEKISSTDEAILVFKAILEILYDENLASNTLKSIKDCDKEFFDEILKKNFDSINTHKILQLYGNDIFNIYETLDSINIETIRNAIEEILFNQKPVIIINEEKNPYLNAVPSNKTTLNKQGI